MTNLRNMKLGSYRFILSFLFLFFYNLTSLAEDKVSTSPLINLNELKPSFEEVEDLSNNTTSNEVSGTNYTAKGNTLTRVDPSLDGTTAITDFADTTWSSSTITARGALIFNEDTSGDTSVLVLNFGSDKSSSSGDFTIAFPAADASNAIIRIA